MSAVGSVLRWLGRHVVLLVALLAAVLVGYGLRAGLAPHAPAAPAVAEAEAKAAGEDEIAFWTCSMHPQIKQPGPGQCPICAMELIPVRREAEDVGPRAFRTGPAALKLMEIETAPVERRFVSVPVRLVGKVTYDETRLAYITAWFPGRLDRLFVDYTGIPVRRGDHMVEIYSPELLAAQEELIQAIRGAGELEASDMPLMRETARKTAEAAREKLRLWGLTPEQIARILERGEVSDHMTVYAPIGGIVVHMNAREGMYVQTGTRLYTIADLSHLWLELDAYESDLPWLRYGQPVEVGTDAYPGETFDGWIAFISPVVDERTRTVKVRVNVPNPEGKLKPDMFVRGVVRATVAEGGRVAEPELMGKWICPMHPEVVRDEPGECDVCGMDLVTPESLGYVSAEAQAEEAPLVIPDSAPLVTGKRAVVYVAAPGAEKPTFEGREIVLGPRAGDFYVVRHGLREGERVVTHGAFKIDSALQIQAKQSMMMPAGGVSPVGHHHGAPPVPPAPPAAPAVPPPAQEEAPPDFRMQFGRVLDAYLGVALALAADDAAQAEQAAEAAREALADVDMALLGHEEHVAWMRMLPELREGLDALSEAEGLAAMRDALEPPSKALAEAIERFGVEPARAVYVIRCPMASGGRGAVWLQLDRQVRNPYFGAEMLLCGEVQEVIQPGGNAHE